LAAQVRDLSQSLHKKARSGDKKARARFFYILSRQDLGQASNMPGLPSPGTERPVPADFVNRHLRKSPLKSMSLKNLLDFFDSGMLQLIEFELFLFDPAIPRDRDTL
jgi:hypothetical protein